MAWALKRNEGRQMYSQKSPLTSFCIAVNLATYQGCRQLDLDQHCSGRNYRNANNNAADGGPNKRLDPVRGGGSHHSTRTVHFGQIPEY